MKKPFLAVCSIAILTGCAIAPKDNVTIVQPQYRIIEGSEAQCKEALIQDLLSESSLPNNKQMRKAYAAQAMTFFMNIQSYSDEMQARLLRACASSGESQAVPRKPATRQPSGEITI